MIASTGEITYGYFIIAMFYACLAVAFVNWLGPVLKNYIGYQSRYERLRAMPPSERPLPRRYQVRPSFWGGLRIGYHCHKAELMSNLRKAFQPELSESDGHANTEELQRALTMSRLSNPDEIPFR